MYDNKYLISNSNLVLMQSVYYIYVEIYMHCEFQGVRMIRGDIDI